jgi:hypothetical protein
MVYYFEVKGQKHPLTFEEIYDFIENTMLTKADMAQITDVINEFSNCQALKRKTEDLAEVNEELKKKNTDGMIQESQPMPQG